MAAGVLFAALAPAGVAVAESMGTIEVHERATLLAKGAAVGVRLTVTCSPELGEENLYVAVWQKQGNEVVQSGTTTTVSCDGTSQTMEVSVPAHRSPFRRGAAFAEGSIYFCSADYSQCSEISGTAEITIGN